MESSKLNWTNKLHETSMESMEHMGHKKNSGSFPDVLLNTIKLEKHQIKDFQVVCIGPGLAFGPHSDLGYMLSSNKSLTMHMHLFFSKDCVYGNANIKANDSLKESRSIIDNKGV